MEINTAIEAVLAAIGVEIAKMVVVRYKNKKLHLKESDLRIESPLNDNKSIKEVEGEQQDYPK